MEVDEEVLMGIPLDRRRIPDRGYLIIVVAAGGVPHPPQPTRLKALKIYDGCNRISAGYEVTGSALAVTLGMGTLRGCGQDVSEQANAYRAGLVGAGEFT